MSTPPEIQNFGAYSSVHLYSFCTCHERPLSEQQPVWKPLGFFQEWHFSTIMISLLSFTLFLVFSLIGGTPFLYISPSLLSLFPIPLPTGTHACIKCCVGNLLRLLAWHWAMVSELLTDELLVTSHRELDSDLLSQKGQSGPLPGYEMKGYETFAEPCRAVTQQRKWASIC